jgi:hypothetical protein
MTSKPHIVVEGVDGAGKSTLITAIHMVIHWPIQGSEGPPLFPGEMDRRVKRYASIRTPCIFDRHPVVSQPIYGTMRSHEDFISRELIDDFYKTNPIFIYCDPIERGMSSHRRSIIDTDAHLHQVIEHYATLLALYRAWAIKHAHIFYRIGDDVDRIVDALKGIVT